MRETSPRFRLANADDMSLLPRPYLLRREGPPDIVAECAFQIDDDRLAEVVDPRTNLLRLYDQAVHSEGPAWDAARNRLVFSDVTGRRLIAWHPDGRVEVVLDATPFVNGNAITADGAIVHCEHLRRCISRSRQDGTMPEPLATHFDGKRLNTPNDLAVARDGAIWFTDPIFGLIMPAQGALAEPELDHRSVYRFDPASGTLTRMADFEAPNGIGFSPDGTVLYVSDTGRAIGGRTHEIFAFDLEAGGTLGPRRLFCHTDHGVPDGFTIDARGWVWTTAGDGIHVYDSHARKLGYLPTSATATNCTFGGIDGRRLFVTAESDLLAFDLRA